MEQLKIGPTLGQLMKAQGFTLKELAKANSVSASTIAEWTYNRVPKNPSQVKLVANAFGCSMHYLLYGVADSNECVSLDSLLKEDLFSGTFQITIKRVKFDQS